MSDVIITVRGEHELRIAPERATVHMTLAFDGADRAQVVERMTAQGKVAQIWKSANIDGGGARNAQLEREVVDEVGY